MYQRLLLLLLLLLMMMMMMTTSLAVSDEDYVLASTSRDSGSYHKTFHSYAFSDCLKSYDSLMPLPAISLRGHIVFGLFVTEKASTR